MFHRLILSQDAKSIQIYDFYRILTNLIVGSDTQHYNLPLPLIELPVILEPITAFGDQTTFTNYEKASKMVNYVYMKLFEQDLYKTNNVSKVVISLE